MAAGDMRVRINGLDAADRRAMSRGHWTLVEDDEPCDLVLDVVAVATPGDDPVSSDAVAAAAATRPGAGTEGGSAPDHTTTPTTVGLTPREQEVLGWMGRGASNADIGHHLFITENTVKNHVRSILRKLECGSRTKAVVTAHQMGLLEL